MTHPETQDERMVVCLPSHSSGNLSYLLQVETRHGSTMSVATWFRADEDEF